MAGWDVNPAPCQPPIVQHWGSDPTGSLSQWLAVVVCTSRYGVSAFSGLHSPRICKRQFRHNVIYLLENLNSSWTTILLLWSHKWLRVLQRIHLHGKVDPRSLTFDPPMSYLAGITKVRLAWQKKYRSQKCAALTWSLIKPHIGRCQSETLRLSNQKDHQVLWHGRTMVLELPQIARSDGLPLMRPAL